MDTFNPNQMPPLQSQPEQKSMGPLISVVIILALIIVGGLYFLKERASMDTTIPAGDEVDLVNASLKKQGTSDDLNSIEADLNATDLNNLDQGATAIEATLNAQ